MLKRAAIGTVGLVALWFLFLLILGVALGGSQERHTRDRLGESLHATVTIGDVDLALVRGRLSLEHLVVRRDDSLGRLAIDVGQVRCELAPLGLALFDRDCRELAVRGTRFELSTATLFNVKRPKSAPLRADRVVIDDAVLVFMPSAFVPGLGRIEITIEHAETGPMVMRTPLSWIFSLRELRARFTMPAGITVQLGYAHGSLTVSGSVFGSTPVELPVDLPIPTTARDAREEIAMLVKLGKDVAERLVAKRAEDWLKSKILP